MKAFHSFWTGPRRGRGHGALALPDHELVTLILSALEWQKHNGPIRMVTDSHGAALFARAGLSGLWSEPLDTSLDELDGTVDPIRFWAAGKLFALRRTDCPCVMLDTDLVVWRELGGLLGGGVVAAHREELSPSVYPEPASAFRLAEGYAFPEAWDFSLPAANTAFLYMPDAALSAYYTDAAFAFMRALRATDADTTVTMCFAEQRLLPMCAKAMGVTVNYLLDDRDLDGQEIATHLWGYKRELAASPERRAAYCVRCVRRIVSDFPAWEDVLAKNAQIGKYLALLRAGSVV